MRETFSYKGCLPTLPVPFFTILDYIVNIRERQFARRDALLAAWLGSVQFTLITTGSTCARFLGTQRDAGGLLHIPRTVKLMGLARSATTNGTSRRQPLNKTMGVALLTATKSRNNSTAS